MKETMLGNLTVWTHPSQGPGRARVLLVHGIGEHSARHLNTIEFLTQNGISVVRFDLRGSGKSQGRRQWIDAFDDYVQDILSVYEWVRKSNNPLPLFLMGHSLGGLISIHFTAQYGSSLTGLILSAPAFRLGHGVPKLLIIIGKVLSPVLPRLRVPGSLDPSAISGDKSVVERYKKDPLVCHFSTIRQGNEILSALEEVPEKVRQISIPIFIAHGIADRIIKFQGSEEILDMVSSTDKSLYKQAAGFHELHNDIEKEAYFAKLLSWLEAHC